jgi:hypothetical protein
LVDVRKLIIAAGLGLAVAGARGCGRGPFPPSCVERYTGDLRTILTCRPDAQCEGPRFTIQARPSNVLLVLDRSCSMNSSVGNSTKWDLALDAIVDVVDRPARRIRWGLAVFPDVFEPVCEQGPLEIPVGEEAERIVALLDAAHGPHRLVPGEPCATNIDAAVRQAADRDVFAGLDGDSHVILITDGRQAGCDAAGGIEGAIQTVAALDERGVPTFVIGFGDGVDAGQLHALGQAGGAPASPDRAYYEAELDGLEDTLGRVVEGLACRYPLRIETSDLSRVTVTFDDTETIAQDPSGIDGWSYDRNADELRFHGDACERLLGREVEIIGIELDC